MGDYVDIGGHLTWVDERGSGAETVLLLHGGLSNSDLLIDAIGPAITERYRVVAFDRRGHGRTADTEGPFHYDDMATETIGVLQQVVGGPAHLVGWSDGGIIALLVGLRRADLVGKLVPIGANYHFDGVDSVPMDETSPVMAMIADSYAERSPDGAEHFPEVLSKSLALFASEPTMTRDDLKQINAPTLVMAADDELVRLDHTASMYEALPAGQLAVVPGSSHALPIEKPAETARLILEFLAADGPPQTFMPIRRHPATG